MDYILYLLIFVIGLMVGKYINYEVYKTQKKQGEIQQNSYFQKYFIQIITGVLFVFFAASIKISLFTSPISVFIYLVAGIIYLTILLIIAGIDRKEIKIDKSALIIGFICVAAYMIYLYIVEKPVDISSYRYIIYLALACFLVLFSVIYLKRKGKDSYTIDILMFSIYMILFTYEAVYIYTVMITLIAVALQLVINGIIKRKKNSKYVKGIKVENSKIPVGFYMGVANIMGLLITNFTMFYV